VDLGNLGENIVPLLLVFVFLAVNILLKRRKGEKTPGEIATSLLSEVTYNQNLMESFNLQWQAKKFKMGSWNRNKAKLNFLDQSLQHILTDTFSIAEDFNREIDAAKKYKSSSYLANISVDRLRTPLAKSKEGLEEHLQDDMGKKEMPPRRRGLFG